MKKINTPEGKDLKAAMKLVENKEFSEAHKVFLKLAGSGSARAQYALGLIYHNGDGCHVDYISATHYFKLSAMQMFEPARDLMYETATMGYTEAIEFFQGSAS